MALANTNFTFSILFLDREGEKIQVGEPKIQVFYFRDDGTKSLLAETAMHEDEEYGRYCHRILIPDVPPYTTIYGVMCGDHPVTGRTLYAEQQLTIAPPLANAKGRFRSSFVRK